MGMNVGGKIRQREYQEKNIPSTDYDGSETSGECGIFQLLG